MIELNGVYAKVPLVYTFDENKYKKRMIIGKKMLFKWQ